MGERHIGQAAAPGRVLHWASSYDLLVWFFTLGREGPFREKILRMACLQPGETVLDVGCGTGTTAMLAKQKVGSEGIVHGIDASPEMIARASAKARKAGVAVTFEVASAQALPFPAAQFDVVLTTLMLHHLSGEARRQLAREIQRILKPTGRVLAVDFVEGQPGRARFANVFHRHGHSSHETMIKDLQDAGLTVVSSGAVGTKTCSSLSRQPHPRLQSKQVNLLIFSSRSLLADQLMSERRRTFSEPSSRLASWH
ncbi:class I SAM-dependent methyltransferase [Rhizobium laguerreae]|uniref:class I SAM-dependent methyltransferase n=1 Tax=Rhizobium laguerreae TaxID=1076926 RepID=UPI001442035F|nr:class I SAM-dependent methyltransferase [Rhizobium laguerreae]